MEPARPGAAQHAPEPEPVVGCPSESRVEEEVLPDVEYEALSSALHAAECALEHGSFVVDMALASGVHGRFSVRGRPQIPCELVKKLCSIDEACASRYAEEADGSFSFALEDYDAVHRTIAEFAPADAIFEIPRQVRELVEVHFERVRIEAVACSRVFVREMVGRELWEKLLNFQRDGVLDAVRKGGRIVLADEMGMGKTVSALALAEFYRATAMSAMCSSENTPEEGQDRGAPVLILCPSTLRSSWAEAVAHWLPKVPPSAVHILMSSRDARRLVKTHARGQRDVWDTELDVKYVICSYDVLPRLIEELSVNRASNALRTHGTKASTERNANVEEEFESERQGMTDWKPKELPAELSFFHTVIADECHNLKNISTARAAACIPMILAAEFRILVSGTPVMSRPAELFALLQSVFGTEPSGGPFLPVRLFEERYCGGSLCDGRGATNITELNALLSLVMVRRSKEVAQLDLPPKVRSHCLLDLGEERLEQVRKKMSQVDQLNSALQNARNAPPQGMGNRDILELEEQIRGARRGLFAATGHAKIPGILTCIRDTLVGPAASRRKLLFFAHHRSVLDSVEEFCVREKLRYVRLDGTTNASSRSALVSLFQNDPAIRIAILSIKTAGTGLTMTSASHVLFGELDWVPSTLTQAEDRAHRIGRTGPVFIEYAVAEGTLDDRMWPAIRRKLGLVGQLVDGCTANSAVLDPEHSVGVSRFAMQATCFAAAAGGSVSVNEQQLQNSRPNSEGDTTEPRGVHVDDTGRPHKRLRSVPRE